MTTNNPDRTPCGDEPNATEATVCTVCGAREDLRAGVCYGCATVREAKGCKERGYHEYDDRPGTAFYDRCVWCDLPRGLAKNFTESHGAKA